MDLVFARRISLQMKTRFACSRRLASAQRSRAPVKDGQHAAFAWLDAGLTITVNQKGRLLPALHALDVDKDWILFDQQTAKKHWGLKLDGYADRKVVDLYWQQAEGTLSAQREVLDMLLAHLPQRYPSNFQLLGSPANGQHVSLDTRIRVESDGFQAEYRVGDFADCPLKLASLLVQEDLILMKNSVIVAGSVFFSFSNFGNRRFGMDMQQLHENVPQYARDLSKPVSRIFDRLKPNTPLWRTNWNMSWCDSLLVDPNRYPHRSANLTAEERQAAIEDLRQRLDVNGVPNACWLKVEYQTLRRLQQHDDCLLFTIRTFVDSMDKLATRPAAAKQLAFNIRRLEQAEFIKYIGIDDDEIRLKLLEYADSIAVSA